MANFIEDANLPTDRFVSALSRYIPSKVVYYFAGNKRVLTFTTYRKLISHVAKEGDVYAVVPPGMEYRPDLVSKKYYGTPDFWWKVLEANNIKDIFDFKAGTNIRLPGNVF